MAQRNENALAQVLSPYASLPGDRYAVSIMRTTWPSNFMLPSRTYTAPLEIAIHKKAVYIDDMLYSLHTLDSSGKLDLVSSLKCLAELLSLYAVRTRLLEEHHSINFAELEQALLYTAYMIQRHVLQTHSMLGDAVHVQRNGHDEHGLRSLLRLL
jgi:hypothetical protein